MAKKPKRIIVPRPSDTSLDIDDILSGSALPPVVPTVTVRPDDEEDVPARGVSVRPIPVGSFGGADAPVKVSKKAKESLEQWKSNRHGAFDHFIKALAERGRRRHGHSAVFVGDETKGLTICIPIPSLAFEFVIANAGFPLGLIMQIVAPTGIGKSALVAEITRWFNLAGGGGVTCGAESKFNPEWYESILQEFFDLFLLHICDSVEDWQRHLSGAVADAKTDLIGTREMPGPGRTVPMLFGVDSIMGKQSEETQEKILGTKAVKGRRGATGKAKKSQSGIGHAARGYPVEAQLITRYMRTIPSELDNWPFSIVLVNHLKLRTTEDGTPERHKAGGAQVDFQESFELELRKIGGIRKKIRCAEFEGIPLEISCMKNSFGAGGRRICTRLLWWYEEVAETGKWKQVSVWDWDWSTIHLLSNILNGESHYHEPMFRANLEKMDFHLETPSAGEIDNLAWSATLGMTAADAAPWSTVGAMIRKDAALTQQLRDALRITTRPYLAGDYLTQLERLREDLP